MKSHDYMGIFECWNFPVGSGAHLSCALICTQGVFGSCISVSHLELEAVCLVLCKSLHFIKEL